ncbi:MAG: aldehyde dehydrogenase family protein [Candidatus Diapherotrites archaeon]
MGPIARKFQLKSIQWQLRNLVKNGNKIIYGKKRLHRKGYYFEPTIIENLKEKKIGLTEPIFGPVILLKKFSSVNKLVRELTNSEYGLNASIWTRNINKAQKIADKLSFGSININSFGSTKIGFPWGGNKKSGIGRLYTSESILEFTNPKHISINN